MSGTVASSGGPDPASSTDESPPPPDYVTITGVRSEQDTTDNLPIKPFSNVTITKTMLDVNVVSVFQTKPANGVLSDPYGGEFSANGNYFVSGDSATVTKAVDALVFTPTKGQVPPGQTVRTYFILSDIPPNGDFGRNATTSVVATATSPSSPGALQGGASGSPGILSGNIVGSSTAVPGPSSSPTPIAGTSGNDVLVGGSSDDKISGGKGDDFILGGSGNDTLRGNQGNDILVGGLGNDVLHGGRGSDIFLHNAGDGQDTITDFQNGDRLVLAGYTLDLHDLNFSDLDTNHDGLLGKGDTSVSFTQGGDLVLNMAAYGAGAAPDTVTLKGVAFLHSTDVAVT